MSFFYVAAGGTLVLAVRLASRFLRRNNDDGIKDDLFFTDDDAGASTTCLQSGVGGLAQHGVPLTRRPSRVLASELSVRNSCGIGLALDGTQLHQQLALNAETLQAISGVQHSSYNNAPDLASVSVSSSEARRRAVSALKVRNWDDTGALTGSRQEAAADGSRSGSAGGISSGDEQSQLAAADSTGSSSSGGLPADTSSPVLRNAAAGQVLDAQPPTWSAAPLHQHPEEQQRCAVGEEPVDATLGPSRAAGCAAPGDRREGDAGCVSLTVASSMVGNCSRNSGTETGSVPLRSCGTGTATMTSSSSPDTSRGADLNEHRSETDSESHSRGKADKAGSASKRSKDISRGRSGSEKDRAADALAAEIVASGRAEQVAAVAAGGGAGGVVVAAAAAASRDGGSSTGYSEGLPLALRSPASPGVPEPLPLPPTILETRAPDPKALLAIQQQVEALRLQHLQRQAQALLTAPAASRAAPLSTWSAVGNSSVSPNQVSPPPAPSAAGIAPLPVGSPGSGLGVGGHYTALGGGYNASCAVTSQTSSRETTLMGFLSMPTSPVAGNAVDITARGFGASGSGMGGAGPSGLRAGTAASAAVTQAAGRASTGSGFGAAPGLPVQGSFLTEELLQQLIQRPSANGLIQQGPQQRRLPEQQRQPWDARGQVDLAVLQLGAGPVAASVAAANTAMPGYAGGDGGSGGPWMSAHTAYGDKAQPQQVLEQQQQSVSAIPTEAAAPQVVQGASRQLQWPDAAIQAARMGTLQLESGKHHQHPQDQYAAGHCAVDAPCQQQCTPQAVVGPSAAWRGGSASIAAPGAVTEARAPWMMPAPHPQGSSPVSSPPMQYGPGLQVLASGAQFASAMGPLPAGPLPDDVRRDSQLLSQLALTTQPGQAYSHSRSLMQPQRGPAQVPLHHIASAPHAGASSGGPYQTQQQHGPGYGCGAGPELRPLPGGQRQGVDESLAGPRQAALWPAAAAAVAGPQQDEIVAAGQVSPGRHHTHGQGGHGRGHVHTHQPQGGLHAVEGSPPRGPGTTTAVPSAELLLSPPSFRHHLRHPGEEVPDLESAKRTAEWINSMRMDDRVSPTLRPHPPPPPRIPAEVSSGEPLLSRTQSPSRRSPSRMSPGHRQSSTTRIRHQDTLESNRSGRGGGGGSSHGSHPDSHHDSHQSNHHRHGSASRKSKRMEQQLLQQKLANQQPPSPLALYSARLLHQAGEKLVAAPRMPHGGGAFFVPLKHEHRLDICSRIGSSAVSVSGQDQEDVEPSSSPLSVTTGFAEHSYMSATAGYNGGQVPPSPGMGNLQRR